MRKLLAALAAIFAINALANDFYTPSGVPSTGAPLVSSTIRNEFAAIGTGFTRLPSLSGNGNAFPIINPGGTGMNVIGPLTNGQLFIGNTGSAPTIATITGTASVLTVTNGAGSITLNLATNPSIPGLIANTMVYAGTSAALTSTAAPTSGQLLIGSTGAAPVLGTISGTGNQITSTVGAGSITLSLPSTVTMPGSLSVTTTTALNGAMTGITAAFTKAAAGDVITFTNGGATPKTGYLYSGPSAIGLFDAAGTLGNGLYIDTTNSKVQLQIAAALPFTVTSTGVNSTAIGATTASTGAFTTGAFSGTITSTVGNNSTVLNAASATTGYVQARLANTSGAVAIGVETSVGGTFIIGDTAYDGGIYGSSGLALSGNNGNAMQLRLAANSITSNSGSGVWAHTGAMTVSSTLGVTGTVRLGTGAQNTYPLEVAGTNGNGIRYWDTTNSVNLFAGAFSSRAILGTISNHPVDFYVNNAAAASLSATGLTVSGTGPHAIGGAAADPFGLHIKGTWAPTAPNGAGVEFQQTITAVAGGSNYGIEMTPTINKAGSGTHPDFATLQLNAPTIGAGAATLTNSTTLKIAGAPSVGTNQRALWVASGLAQFDGTTAFVTKAVGDNTTNAATTAFVSSFPQQITASLGADVALNNASNFLDGPSVAQGSSGTWFASGSVSVVDTAAAASIVCKLWDGTTVIASSSSTTSASGFKSVIALSGYIASPAGNIRISCKDLSATTGKMLFNDSGASKDGTVSAFKVAN